MSNDRKREGVAGWSAVGVAMAIPAILAASPIVGYLLGQWADGWLGSAPYGGLAGLLLGLAAGVRETVLLVRRLNSDNAG
jgi:F0F1-type ATP synthase assembly protein I